MADNSIHRWPPNNNYLVLGSMKWDLKTLALVQLPPATRTNHQWWKCYRTNDLQIATQLNLLKFLHLNMLQRSLAVLVRATYLIYLPLLHHLPKIHFIKCLFKECFLLLYFFSLLSYAMEDGVDLRSKMTIKGRRAKEHPTTETWIIYISSSFFSIRGLFPRRMKKRKMMKRSAAKCWTT